MEALTFTKFSFWKIWYAERAGFTASPTPTSTLSSCGEPMDTSPSSELMTTPVSAYQHATSGVRRSFDASGAHGGKPKLGATL